MGFLQLIPAQQLKAVYNAELRSLLLQGRGDAQNFTSGIAFQARTSERGELVFALMGWVGPIGKGTTAYEHNQRFDSIDFPGHAVTIEDSNHPGGVQVSVEVIVGAAAPSPAAAPAPAPAQEVQRIPLGGSLALTSAASVPSQGSVAIAFDHAYLSMQTAGIQNPSALQITWGLQGTKLGETLVTITTSGGIAKYITVRTVKVLIEPPVAK